jgi:transcriptional regulator with XRE-family HTH domain
MDHPLRSFRTRQAITLEAAATQIGVSSATLSRIENAKQLPSSDLLRRIAEWSKGEVTPNDILGISALTPAPEASDAA